MQIIQTNSFRRAAKKLPKGLKKELDKAVLAIIENKEIGTLKVGDLAGIRVYKFKLNNQNSLLAYSYNDETITLTLLALGSHENFYRDLKRTEF